MPSAMRELSNVDWDVVDGRLPSAQIPAEQEKRYKMFGIMDTSGNRKLTLSELQSSFPNMMVSEDRARGEAGTYIVPVNDLKPAIKLAFKAAKGVYEVKGKKKRSADHVISRDEFHAFLVAFRCYIELEVIFAITDRDDDRRLNWQEAKKVLPILEEWNISEQNAKDKFPDDWTASMKYDDFAEWCIMRKMRDLDLDIDQNDVEDVVYDLGGGGDTGKVLEAFAKFDTDDSGWITLEELSAVLLEIDDKFKAEDIDALFQASDVNKDGMINFTEFTKWLSSATES